MIKKLCAHTNCKNKFKPIMTTHIYCLPLCRHIERNKRAKKKYQKICPICNKEIIRKESKKCRFCAHISIPKDMTLGEAIYTKHHKSSAYALVRIRARRIAKKLGWKTCFICGYDKHVEISHIKPICEFSMKTKLSDINKKANLVALCPNCHWEFDKGLLKF